MCMNSGFSILRHLELLTRNVILRPLYFIFLQFIQVETDRGYM